jgi:hypothetical protein
MRSFVIVGAALLVVLCHAALAQPPAHSFEAAVARLRASFEQSQQMPLDPDLYAPNLHVSHNYEAGRIVDVPVFLAGVARELAAAKQVGANDHAELTRFLASGDTVVATVLNTGKLADGSPTRFYIAYFFKIADGRVVDLETWYDRKGAEQQAQAIANAMKSAATAPKTTPDGR